MKIARFFSFLILLGCMGLVVCAQTPIDPKVIINFGSDPDCGPDTPFTCYTGVGPLTVPFATTLSLAFVYDPPPAGTRPNLIELLLDFTGVPFGTPFQCESNIWTDCTITQLPHRVVQFDMFGSGHCKQDGGVGGECIGFLAPDQSFTVDASPLLSETPEPNSFMLFGTGLVSILVVAKRRWSMRA
jgi:hypothetical protein